MASLTVKIGTFKCSQPTYFLENEAGLTLPVTLTSALYIDLITEFFLPKLDDIVVDDM